MTLNYGAASTAARDVNKRVVIVQVNILTMMAIGVEGGSGPMYNIDLSLYHGEFACHPNLGEEWVVTKSMGKWVLDRRTTFQNTATTAILASSPGTTVFANHGKLQFVDTQVTFESPIMVNGSSVNAVGTIILWSTATTPTGYLRCTGASVSRTTYANLFAVIGLSFNASAPAGFFNVPTMTDPATGIHYLIKT